MLLDPLATVTIALIACAAFAAGLFALAQQQDGPEARAPRTWARALLLAPMGWLMMEIVASGGPPWLAVPGKTLIIAAFVEYLRALRQYRGGNGSSPWYLVTVAGVAVASALYLVLRPGTGMSTGLLSALCALYAGLAVREAVLESRRAGTLHGLLVAIGLGSAGAMLAMRATLLALPEASLAHAWILEPGPRSVVLGTVMMAPAVATMGFVLMGSDRLLNHVHRMASIDALTGLLNRGAFLSQAHDLLERSRSEGRACTLLMVDLDRFKNVNDSFGHETGDRALNLVAGALSQELRGQDLLGRVGGEEFAILLPDLHAAGGQAVAERLRVSVKAQPLLVNGDPLPLSVSVGVSERVDSSDDLSLLMRRADQAMYQAKDAGRDRVRLHVV